MALSDQLQTVRSWFASTPGANPNPSEEDLKYYAEQGIGKFLTDVASIRSADPQLATKLDQQRTAMAASGSPFGSITGSMFNIPSAVRTNYVPFSALLQPMGTRGFGNYGYGPGMLSAEQPKPAEPIPQPPLPSQTSSFPTFDLNAWYNPPASLGSGPGGTVVNRPTFNGDFKDASGWEGKLQGPGWVGQPLLTTQTGLMGDQASQLAMIIAAIQAALTGQKPAAELPKEVKPADLSKAVKPIETTKTAQPVVSDSRLEDIRQAFLSIPGANPNPDREALEYYASQGVDKLKADVAFIRQANPAVAAQIDAERNKLGLS